MSLKDMLAKPTPPVIESDAGAIFTSQVEAGELTATVELKGDDAAATEGAARDQLIAEGLDPDAWLATGFRTSRWTMPGGGEGVSRRFSFARARGGSGEGGVDVQELVDAVNAAPPAPFAWPEREDRSIIVALGDMQFGKDLDGDQNIVEHAVERTVRLLRSAATVVEQERPKHVVIGWLGDHVEGFVSQGGANAWRTTLTLSEQIRLLRRVMLKAVEIFAPLAPRVSMVAVPGNHGETIRFGKNGVTRYDDSHDTESLIAVADACRLNGDAFGHVEFFVPETDEMTVTVELGCGTRAGFVHGHQWRTGQHLKWWQGQAFHGSPLASADVLFAGHLHHLRVEQEGNKMFVQVPALEGESTWYRHSTGTVGNPGLLTVATAAGQVKSLEVLR